MRQNRYTVGLYGKRVARCLAVCLGALFLGAAMPALEGCGMRGSEPQQPTPGSDQTPPASERPLLLLEQTAPLVIGDADAENPAGSLQRHAGGAMVQIEAEGRMGSGVLWRQEQEMLYIVTAAHVVGEDTAAAQIVFIDGWETTAEEIYICESADLAFLGVDIRNITGEQAAQYRLPPADREGYDRLEKGDGVILMASVRDVAGDAYEGSVLEPWIYIEDFGQYMIYLRVPAYPGMSGGGVFDREGNLLGIFCGAAWQEDGGTGELSEGAAVPLAIMLTEYENFRKNERTAE